MPTTVNGIGTHYYGKKNRKSRTGVCRSCGARCTLESYDTRLWFVIVFIPVIPLGRRRIMDCCSVCSRHYAASLSRWEMSRQLNVSGAMDRYRTEPSPETALEVHGNLLGFHAHDEADQFRNLALEQYPESAVLCAGLASQLNEIGRFPEAIPLFEKALVLRADLPEARIGVAFARMNQGKLDEARELLSFLEQPGAGQLYSLGPLESLAHAYQRAGRHDVAMALCERILAEFPAAGQVHDFRKFVAVSEKALRRETVLPKRGFSLRGLFDSRSGRYAPWQRWAAVGAAVAAMAIVGMLGMNEYRRRHRTVHVINQCGRPAQMTIDEREPLQVDSMATIELPEGQHRVKIAGAADEEFDVEMHTGFFERWTKSPIWVINVGGAAAIVDETVYYAANPVPSDARVVVGETFHYSPHVDYPFQTMPPSIRVDSKSARVVKTHLELLHEPAQLLFQYAMATGEPSAAFRFAETHLRRDPEDRLLLAAYSAAAKTKGQSDRAEQFLKGGLWRQPISVPWHRAYLDLKRTESRAADLAAQYDALLKAQPTDARLLYLRGRATAETGRADEFFRRSNQSDATLPWPWMALAYHAASRGDWPLARSQADKAIALNLDEPGLHAVRHSAHIATGNSAAVESEYRQLAQSGQPGENARGVIYLCDVLVGRGKVEEARKALADWEARLPPAARSGRRDNQCRQALSYMTGDFAALVQNAAGPGVPDDPEIRLHALAAMGRPQDAVKDAGLAKALQEPWHALALSLAFSLSGSEAEAAKWRQQASAALEGQDADSKRAAALLRSATPPTRTQLDEFVMYPSTKAILLAVFASRFPQQKAELAAMARSLNVSRLPPYHLVKKATEGR
jgi:tetratricopeptide (TPR) repeat protein